MVLIINELSYADSENINQAKSWYDDFFQLCLKVEKDYQCKLSLKYSNSPSNYTFHSDYTFMKWLSNQNREEKSSVLSMLTKQPIIHDYPYYKAYGSEGKGIGYAYENDEILISFGTSCNWCVHYLPVIQEQINEETNELESEELNLRNYYNKENLGNHNNYISVKLKSEKNDALNSVTNGNDLWAKTNDIFPNLLFCNSTEEFIKASSGDVFKGIFKRFKEFETYFSKWKNGDFEKDSLPGDVRLESDTRINKFTNQLTITCPDGENKLFSLHCNIGVWGYRIHFYPDVETRKCIIGYVGKKIN